MYIDDQYPEQVLTCPAQLMAVVSIDDDDDDETYYPIV